MRYVRHTVTCKHMSETATIDRRVTRTHKLLGQALVELAIEKGYEEVTIQDVTDRADIGYRTFFRHFASKDELLLAVAQTTLDELEPLIHFPKPEQFIHESAEETAARATILFDFVEEREQLFRVLLLERGSRHFLKPVMEHGRQQAREQFDISAESLPLPIDMIVNQFVTASLSMVRWWLENDMPYTTTEMGKHMAEIIMMPNRLNLLRVANEVNQL